VYGPRLSFDACTLTNSFNHAAHDRAIIVGMKRPQNASVADYSSQYFYCFITISHMFCILKKPGLLSTRSLRRRTLSHEEAEIAPIYLSVDSSDVV
jgi:hypothetical protein